jgi:hypothetical protein
MYWPLPWPREGVDGSIAFVTDSRGCFEFKVALIYFLASWIVELGSLLIQEINNGAITVTMSKQ